MKEMITKDRSTIRVTHAVAAKHPSYRNPVVHAAAALRHLSEQYNRKAGVRRKTGHA
jgi:hypothetical protein